MVGRGHIRGRAVPQRRTRSKVREPDVRPVLPAMRTVATATNQSGNENRTWDEYASELSSGHLSWTPAHSSDFFWRENVTKLNEKDHFYLKFVLPAEVLPKKQKQISSARQLIELLRSSQDTLVLAVAAHDLGQYVKYHERGKK